MRRRLMLFAALALCLEVAYSADRYEVVVTSETCSKVYLAAQPMDGTPVSESVKYQWYKDGEAISGATKSTYIATHMGEYKCQINDRTFTTTSYTVECSQYGYQVGFADKSNPHPWEGAECWEDPITLEVTRWYSEDDVPSSGTTFQWYTYDENGDTIRIPGATGATYDATEGGTYTCIVTEPGTDKGITCTTVTLNKKEYPWLFDNGLNDEGNHDWFDKANWYPNRNRIPNIKSNAIIKEGRVAWVDFVDVKGVAQTKTLEMRESSGLVVKQEGRMAVDGKITRKEGARISLENGADGYGALTVKEGDVQVNTSVYGYAKNTGTYDNNVVWQYFTVPVKSANTADVDFSGSWITKWTEDVLADPSTKLGSNWSYIVNGDSLNLFEGYALTQMSIKNYPLSGTLVNSNQKIAGLSYTGENVVEGNVYAGYHLLGNSFSAPIDVAKMEVTDIVNAEPTFYLFNYGTWNQWEGSGSKAGTNAGQYIAIPVNLARTHSIPQTVIPSMQGFYLFTNASDASVTFDYLRTVHTPNIMSGFEAAPKSFAPGRKPQVSDNESPIRASVGISAATESYYDYAKLFMENECSDLYDAGWDGRKIIGNTNVPQVYFVSADGRMQYNVTNYVDGQCFEVQAGKELYITLQLEMDGVSDIHRWFYLHDLTTDTYVELQDVTEYSYMASKRGEKRRFCLTTYNPNRVSTGIETEGVVNHSAGVYDVLGRRIENSDQCVHDGVYIIVNPDGVRKEVR